MKKVYSFGSVFFMLVSLNAYGQKAQDAFATITYINEGGKVFCKKANTQTWLNAHTHFSLDIGDAVKAGDDTRVIILTSKGKRTNLLPHQVHVIQSDTKKENTFLAYLISFITGENIGPTKPGVRGEGDPPLLLFPQKGKLLSARPDFVWLASAENTTYQIRLEKAAGNNCKTPEDTILKEKTKDTMFVFPAETANLIPGMMYWAELMDKNSRKTTYSDCFYVVGEAERDRVQKEFELIRAQYDSDDAYDLTWIYAAATYLFVNEFYTETLRLLRKASLEHPDDVTLRSLLDHVYDKLELYELISGKEAPTGKADAEQTSK